MAHSQEAIETLFTKAIELIEEGHSLRKVCSDHLHIGPATFYKWCDGDEEKQKRYVRATSIRADVVFDEMLEIADDGKNDTYVDALGNMKTDYDVIARSKLRIDTRKWQLSKMKPEKYADKIEIDHRTKGEKVEQVFVIGGKEFKF